MFKNVSRKSLIALMLAFAMLISAIPISAVGFLESGLGLEADEQDSVITLQKLEPGMMEAEGFDLQRFDNAIDASNGFLSLSQARNALANKAASNSEELNYVVSVAEMLTEKEGVIELDHLRDDENAYVFVWLQELPTALEQLYASEGINVQGYNSAKSQAAGARQAIRDMENGLALNNAGSGASSLVIEWEYFHIFAGFAIHAPMSMVRQIAEMPGVYMVTEVGFYELEYTPDPEYTTRGNAAGREATRIGELHAMGVDGSGVNVGIIDSGIQPGHPDIAGAYKGGYNFVRNTTDMSTPDGSHGIHVAGTIASQGIKSLGVAPGANIYMAQAFESSILYMFTSGSDAVVTAALEAFTGSALGQSLGWPQMDVINMSLGFPLSVNNRTAYVTGAFARNNAVIAGTVVVNSAGNSGFMDTAGNNFTNERRSYTITSGGVSLPISVAATQYGGDPMMGYDAAISSGLGDGIIQIAAENFDADDFGIFRNGSFGYTETHQVTYTSSNTSYSGVNFLEAPYLGTYTRQPLVNVEGKGYELYYACQTAANMTEDDLNALKALPNDYLAGKILVINRGMLHTDTLGEALRLGAGAVILMNVENSYFGGFLMSAISSANMPVFSGKLDDRQVLVNLTEDRVAFLDPGNIVYDSYATEPASFSSTGPVFETAHIKPDITAPGHAIYSLGLAGGYESMSGTSMSSPFVAGVAALVIGHLKDQGIEWDPAEVKARIMNTADAELIKPISGRFENTSEFFFNPNGTESSVYEHGSGFVNPMRAVFEPAYITVEHVVPTGHFSRANITAQMASFSFGNTIPGQTTEKMTATVHGGSAIQSIRIVYNHDTRYSNANLNSAVVARAELTGADTFDVWLEVRDHASTDGSNGSAGNLYEGLIYVTVDGVEYVLPWATRVGDIPETPPPPLVIENQGWLLYPDRPVVSSWNTGLREQSNYSHRSMMFLNFTDKEVMDSVKLRIVPITSGANAGRFNYFLDLVYARPFASEAEFLAGNVVPAYRYPVQLGTNVVSGEAKLSDFLDIGDYYIFVHRVSGLLNLYWDEFGLPMQAQLYNPTTGAYATSNSNIAAGNYQLALEFEDGLDYYFEFGFTVADTAPLLTIYDSYTDKNNEATFGNHSLPTTGQTNSTAANALTVDLFGYYDFGAAEYTVKGRMFDPGINGARFANQAAADALAEEGIVLYPGFVWAGYHMYNFGEVVPVTQNYNVFQRTNEDSIGFFREVANFNDEMYIFDDDGYFELTFPTPANKAEGFMITEPGFVLNRIRGVAAFEQTYGIFDSGGILGGRPGYYLSGSNLTPFWRQSIGERKALVTVVAEPALSGTAAVNAADGLYYSTDTVTLTAEAAEGFDFVGFFDADGHLVSLANPYSFAASAMSGDTVFTAMFTDEAILSIDEIKPVLVIGQETAGQVVAEAIASGFGGAPVFSVEPALPAGLSIDAATGRITVTDPAALAEKAASSYKLTAAAGEDTAEASLVITIANAPAITTETLPDSTVGAAYSQTIATTGTGPITVSLLSGELPLGLTLAENGALSGQPLFAGVYTFTVAATNVTGVAYQATSTYTIRILGAPEMMTFSLHDGYLDNVYHASLVATGANLVWSLESGTLPPGLVLLPEGTITGMPEITGTSSFVVKAANDAGSVTAALAITINCPEHLYPETPVRDGEEWLYVCQRIGCGHEFREPIPPISFMKIVHKETGEDAAPMIAASRNGTMSFAVRINYYSSAHNVVWSVNNANLASVDQDGNVTIKGNAGNVTLTVRAPSGVTHSIVLRIT